MSCWGQQLLSYFTHYTKKCKWFMSGLLTTWDLGPQWADTKTLPPYFLSSPLLSFLSFSLAVKEILITEHKIGRTEDFTAMNLKKTQNKKTLFFYHDGLSVSYWLRVSYWPFEIDFFEAPHGTLLCILFYFFSTTIMPLSPEVSTAFLIPQKWLSTSQIEFLKQ